MSNNRWKQGERIDRPDEEGCESAGLPVAPVIPDPADMTPEELDAFLDAGYPATPLKLFPLSRKDGRDAFLHELYMIGYSALFEGVAHVWDSLAEPRAARCTQMGLEAGTGGKGKSALRKMLNQFITDGLATWTSLPERSDFADFESWNTAAQASFKEDEADLPLIIARYSDILNGGPDETAQDEPKGQLIEGPWPAGVNVGLGPDDDPESRMNRS